MVHDTDSDPGPVSYGLEGSASAFPNRRGLHTGLHAGPHAGKGPKGYRRSQERILEDVCERLAWSGDLDASNIEVSVDEDEVTLEGTVDSRQAKRMAEDLAESASGVKDVHNRLRIHWEHAAGLE